MDWVALSRIAFFVCAAVTAIFVVEAIFLAVFKPLSRKRSVNRRMKVMDNGVIGEETMVSLKSERGIFSESLEFAGGLRKLLVQSGLRLSIGRFVTYCGLLCVGVFGILKVATTLPSYAVIGIALLLGALLPRQIVKFMRSRRQHSFSQQLPDALDIIVRSLRSGHPVPVALALVGREMPDPAGTEFGMTVDEMTYGLDLPRALKNLADRVGVDDLSLLVTAVSLQSQSGGNLSEVLGNLSRVLRERFQLRRKVRAFSAEARFSGIGLSVLPVVIGCLIYVQNPKYYTDVLHEPIFIPVWVGLVLWSILGDFIMFKMINFKY
jgi:tight adherence protein B